MLKKPFSSVTSFFVMQSSPPNVMCRRDLLGPRLSAWNVLLQRLATVQLQNGSDEFCWNLHKKEKFFVDTMYNALIQPDVPFDNNNNKLWKLKIPLKSRFDGTSGRE
jgi:hypothetical protein